MKFSLLPYSRPDFEAAKQFYTGAAERLKAAVSFEQAESVFLEVEKFSDSFDTLCTIANIRHDIDTRDGFYDRGRIYRRALPRAGGILQGLHRSDARLPLPAAV